MYDCDLTIIQSMPDDTHAFQLLSGKSLALQLTNPHYDETVQWRKTNVQGVVQPLFLAQRGMEYIMGTELLSSSLSTHAPRPQIDSTVGSGPRAVTAARPRMTPPSAAGAPSAGPLATQASTGQCAGLGQQAVSNNTRGRGTAASTTHQVPSTTGTIAPRPVTSQAVQPAYVGEEAVSGNTRGKSTATSAPISALTGPPSGSGRLSRSNSRSNTADVGPLNQASGSNVPVSLLPRSRVNDNIFSGLSSGSDGEYCTWLSKNKLAPLLGAPSYRLFHAGSFQGTFVNPTLYSAVGARWRPNAPTSDQFVHARLSAAIRSQAFDFLPTQQADLNLPVLSLSSRIECDGIFYSPLSADTRKTLPYCVLYSDGDVEWRSVSEARSEHRAPQQLARLLSISSHDSLVGMLGLRVACGYQEVAIEYNKSLKLINPDQCFLDGAAEAFMKLQPAYTKWNTARARQGWSHPAAPSSAPVNSDSRHPNDRPSSHGEGRGGLGARPPLASQSTRPGVPQQRTGAESAPSGSNSANVPQNAGINLAPAHDSIFRHFIFSLNPDDPSVTWINAGALDFLSRLERDGRLLELRAFTSPTATDLKR